MMIRWLTVIAIVCVHSQAEKSYDGYQLLRATPSNKVQVELLARLEQNDLFDFWSSPKYGPVDIMAGPEDIQTLEANLNSSNIPFVRLNEDIGREIKHQSTLKASSSDRKSTRYNMGWDIYHSLSDIHEFAYALEADFPELVTVENVGSSFEGRDILLVKVSSGGNSSKPAIWVEAGIHAREWISPSTATFILRELVENFVDHPQYVNDVDWYFMPSVNPDGYEYTRSQDRLWRKTRGANEGSLCLGTDGNRNWDFQWGVIGVSTNPCSDTYGGDQAFSEVEMAVTRDALARVASQIKLFIGLHSYGQYFLTPYGYTAEPPANFADQVSLAKQAISAIKDVRGTEYEAGSTALLLYPNSGTSRDYAYGVLGINYAYTIELSDDGTSGFLLPPTEIVPVGEEMWEGFKVLADFVAGSVKN